MPSSAHTGRESDKFNLRLPDGMRDRIAEAAKASGRSMNSEIVYRLEQTFFASDNVDEVYADPSVESIVEVIIEKMKERGYVWNPAKDMKRPKA